MSTLVAADYNYQFLDTGVLLNGPVDTVNGFVDVNSVDGLDSAPFRSSNRVREGQDGGFLDSLFEDMRTIVISGNMFAPAGLVEIFLDTLKANFAPNTLPQPFYFQHPQSGVRTVFCKSLGIRYSVDQLRRVGQSPFQITLQAEDPSIYGSLVTVTGSIQTATTGRAYNRAYNYGYGGTTGTSGGVVANNTGNKPTPALIRIYNVTNPELVNDATGQRLKYTIALNDPNYLEIELRNKTVLLNGTANRRGSQVGTSQWFLLQPGSNSIRLLGAAGIGTPQVTVSFRPAYR